MKSVRKDLDDQQESWAAEVMEIKRSFNENRNEGVSDELTRAGEPSQLPLSGDCRESISEFMSELKGEILEGLNAQAVTIESHLSRVADNIVSANKDLVRFLTDGGASNAAHQGILKEPNLYPTVGLQTPGEVVDANFGQEPFVFDIEDMMKELQARTKMEIRDFPVPAKQSEWQAILNKMVSTYLIHHGYCNTAEAFAQITNQPFTEDIHSIKNRQKILKLVLSGRMGEAIERTSRLYPGLLENNQNLLFMLKCRQFVEMVNGSDIEVCHRKCGTGVLASPRPGSPIQTSVIQSTKGYSSNKNNKSSVDEMNETNSSHNGNCPNTSVIQTDDDCMEVDNSEDCNNGQTSSENCPNITDCPNIQDCQNGKECHTNENCLNDVDTPLCRKSCSKPAVERILEFGRDLYSMSQRLKADKTSKQHNQEMMHLVY
ncbi:unnamed protein product [Ceutorhynchus assimilis]|uniref:CTLH domain-containing protein n=1 Tax=Ceutorhynchus assimilis TaxID=467358 RepID=A0A9N9QL89_9CUCU|nr:unnamed protein product [Ceutorhynchus assimilis]